MPPGRPSKVNAVARRGDDGEPITFGQLVAAGDRAGLSLQTIHTWRTRGAELAAIPPARVLTADEGAMVAVYEALGAPALANGRTVPCNHCGRLFPNRNGSRYCSDGCRSTYQSERTLSLYRLATQRGMVRRGMTYFRALVDYLVQRDGARCGICGGPIDKTLRSGPQGDPMGPSLDHVIPRSQDGPDTLANLRLTHWTCNRQRGNRGGNEQLALIG